jgi:hypothetical protein
VRDVAGDALTDLQPDGAHLVALDDARHELPAALVEEIQRRPVRFDRVVDLLENELEELIEIERRPEREADLAEGLAFARLNLAAASSAP